jgi:arylsulfatase A-like enzyme
MSPHLRRGLLLLLACLPAFGCAPEKPLRGKWNILLLSIDTLRADHLGAYGYRTPTSPAIDTLAKEGIVFEKASAQAPSTLLSHAAMLTSQIPQHHRASHVRYLPLAEDAVTLAEVLAAQGYETVSWNGGGQLDRAFGLAQGFDVYEKGPDPFDWAVGQTETWLAARRSRGEERPFFLFLHTYEAHHPYTPRPEDLEVFDRGYAGYLPKMISVEQLDDINHRRSSMSPEDLEHIIATYDAEIRSVDRGFGRVLEALRQQDLLDQTLIVLTSDHGEEFGEHGLVGWHSHSLYEELLWVPLIFRLPDARFAGQRQDRRVRSIDIAPTLLDLLGVPAPPSFEGRSLAPFFEKGATPPEEEPAIAFRDNAQGDAFESLTIRRHKLNEGKLFDLETDPWEKRDQAAADPETLESLRRQLARLVAARPGIAPASPVELGEEERERLRALGYVGEPAAGKNKP